MTKGNGYIDNVPYRFNKRRDLWLRIITNPYLMIAVATLVIVLFFLSDKL